MYMKHGDLTGAFSSADWAGSVTDGRSTSGYCTFFCGNLVMWQSMKQPVVAIMSVEAEFHSIAHENVKSCGYKV